MEKVNMQEQLVVLPLSQLTEIIKETVDGTMEKWLQAKIDQEREDKASEETMLTPREVAKQYKLGLSTVYQKINDKTIPSKRIGKKILIVKKDVQKLFDAGKIS